MKKENVSLRVAKWIAIILPTILVFSCMTNHESDRGNIELKIITPYNCGYQFLIKDEKLFCRSQRLEFLKDSFSNITSDTIFSIHDTLIDSNTMSKITVIKSGIDFENADTIATKQRETNLFEIYSDKKLIKRINGYDKNIYAIMKLLRPYIDNKKIQCCDFFLIFDNATSEGG